MMEWILLVALFGDGNYGIQIPFESQQLCLSAKAKVDENKHFVRFSQCLQVKYSTK